MEVCSPWLKSVSILIVIVPYFGLVKLVLLPLLFMGVSILLEQQQLLVVLTASADSSLLPLPPVRVAGYFSLNSPPLLTSSLVF